MNTIIKHWTFFLCCGGLMCLALATNLPPVYLTTFGETFGGAEGLGEAALGRIPAAVFGGLMVGIILAGPVAHRWGAKRIVMAGLVIVGAGLTGLSLVQSYAALLVSVSLLGLGAGVLEVVLSPIVAALYPGHRAAAMNWFHSFYCIGAVCTVLVGSAALRLGISWRAVSVCVVGAPLCVLLGFATVDTPPLTHENAEGEPVRSLVRHGFFLATLALIFLCGALEISVGQWLPAYAERSLGNTKANAGFALAAFSVAMVVGRIISGFIVRHVRVIPFMVACCLASAGLIAAGCFAPFPGIALASCIAVGLTLSCFWPSTLGLASNRFPRGGAPMFGLLGASGNLGCMAMPWTVGVIAERSSLNWGLATVALCPLLMAVLLTGMAAAERRDPV